MKTHKEIFDKLAEGLHPCDDPFINEYTFDGDVSFVKQAMNEHAKQYLLEVKNRIDAQCGNKYGTITFIDGLIAELDKPIL